MKTATMLLGLVTAACNAPASYPLCNGDGTPACGNVGQAGRPVAAAPRTAPPPPVVRVLVGASREVPPAVPVGRPLVDREARPACGNVVSKRPPEPCPDEVLTADSSR